MNWFTAHPDAERFAKDTYQTYPGKQKHGVWEHIHAQLVERFQYPGSKNACRVALTDQWRGAVGDEAAITRRSGTVTSGSSPDTSIAPLISPFSPKPLTEAEALALFAVDTAKWEVQRLSHNTWQQGSTGPDGETLTRDLYQTTLHLKRRQDEGLTELTNRLLASLTAAAPKSPPFVVKRTKADHLLEVDAFDIHLGKVAWSQETGGDDYDLGIAGRDFRDAVDDVLGKTRGFSIAKALFPVGNDLLQTDNLRSETTAGTRVDSDSRYHKVFEAAVTEMRWAIDRLKDVAPLVEVKGVSGNHDRLGGWSVVRVLQAIYESDPRVTFDNAPTLRKYARWGKTLLGYTHGNEEKPSDLPLIMAQERREDWAETLFRLWRTGHYHKSKRTMYVAGDTLGGVEHRILRSLSAADSWHAMKGFIGGRRAIEAFVHHIEEGEVGAFVSRLPQR